MEVDERTRRLVHGWAASSGGPEVADALMAMLPPGPGSELATRADLQRLEAGLRGEMAGLRSELRGEMAELRGELKGDMADLRAELKGDMAELRAELKGETTELRGEIRGLLPRLYAANLLGMIGVSGLVLAAAHWA